MQSKLTCLAFLAASLASCNSMTHDSDEHSHEHLEFVDWGDNPMENPEFMEKMMELGTPGEDHAELMKSLGEWDVEYSMYMEPGAEPMLATATATRSSLLGGRYVMEEFVGTFMDQPFEGLLIQGFNKMKGEYFSMWMDTWSTWPSIMHGTETAPGTIESHGVMHDLMTPDGRPYRSIVKEVDDNTGQMMMYDTMPDGTEMLVMEMNYKRK